MTREEVAKVLNTNAQNVRNLERRGHLGQPHYDQHGTPRYEQQVVDKLRERRYIRRKDPTKDVKVLQDLYGMFDIDMPLPLIVRRTGLLPEDIGRAYRVYLGGLQQWASPPKQRARGRSPQEIAEAARIEAEARDATRQHRTFETAVSRYTHAREQRIASILPKPLEPLTRKKRGENNDE